ncbi:hypothetical protein WB401_42410 [Streptomyces brasiliscabiei]|uniref:Membrane-bound hydrophilic protein n=1 Tax=Streptomyces brasiliscabiei TaxID=2736302 RepID=A0ABU8GNW1_9ACTN
MPADEVTHGTSVGESRARSGPRHAAPRKPLLTRLNVPAGKAIALAAMPTAVLMGMGFTPTITLARADDPAKLSLTADEYKDCVEALEAAEEGTDSSGSPTPTPSASASESADSTDDGTKDEDTSAEDDSTSGTGNSSGDSASDDTSSGSDSTGSSSSDSGSDDKDATDKTDDSTSTGTAGGTDTAASDTGKDGSGNVLEDIGSALEDLFTPDDKETESTTPSESATSPSPSPSDSAPEDTSGSDEDTDAGSDSGKETPDTTDKVEESAKDVTGAADDAKDTDDTKDTEEAAEDDATATPSPSPSESLDAEGCPVATDDESGVEKGIPALPDDPWYLNASSLLLKGADYKGVVKVKTADGTVKEVLKYVISDGTDIGDLHQTVDDKQAGVTYHVQAGKGTTSTIRDGQTIMYTESISGNLLGLIPVTFDPKHPPPLNIPLIYFTKVKVVQAGQFGGTLTVPGLHQYTTD